jgi:hypothetical protein
MCIVCTRTKGKQFIVLACQNHYHALRTYKRYTVFSQEDRCAHTKSVGSFGGNIQCGVIALVNYSPTITRMKQHDLIIVLLLFIVFLLLSAPTSNNNALNQVPIQPQGIGGFGFLGNLGSMLGITSSREPEEPEEEENNCKFRDVSINIRNLQVAGSPINFYIPPGMNVIQQVVRLFQIASQLQAIPTSQLSTYKNAASAVQYDLTQAILNLELDCLYSASDFAGTNYNQQLLINAIRTTLDALRQVYG